jgi:hypothetical protein
LAICLPGGTPKSSPDIIITKQTKKEKLGLAGQTGGLLSAKFGPYSALTPVPIRDSQATYNPSCVIEDEELSSFGVEPVYELSALFTGKNGGRLLFNFQPLKDDISPSFSITVYNGEKRVAKANINTWGQAELVMPGSLDLHENWENLSYIFSPTDHVKDPE